MKVSVYRLMNNGLDKHDGSNELDEKLVNLVLAFGNKAILEQEDLFNQLQTKFPMAEIAMCSTSGEIYQNEVLDNSLVAVAMQFAKTTIQTASVNIQSFDSTIQAAQKLVQKLPSRNLSHVLVFSDGSLVNGSELVKGLSRSLPVNVMVTGGLAGDGANFESTLVGLNSQPAKGEIVAVGLYGKDIEITHGSQGGWEMFGLEKRITKSTGNVLKEIEGQNALELYKKYLGEEAKKLPGSALLFPLSVTLPGVANPVVRTILSINEQEGTMTFAGDVPEGATVKFMKANFDKLTLAAEMAANFTAKNKERNPVFSLLISCVGRKLILGEKTVEEVLAVRRALGEQTVFAGFYSYGEISPFNEGGNCQLHNQTMTITSFYEH